MKLKILNDRNVLQVMALSWQLLQAVTGSIVLSYEINGDCSIANEGRYGEAFAYQT
jgi:hypothetical protein